MDADSTEPNEPRKRQKRDHSPARTIRATPLSKRHFWKESIGEQISQTVVDQNPDYIKRTLTENEVTVLALNEIAAEHGRGFFFHLPSRLAWTSAVDRRRLPTERIPKPPGAEYPTIVVMNFKWTARARRNFFADSQRARYLRSSILANPPPNSTPLYGIQYAVQRCPVFATSENTLVIFATKDRYYLCRTSELETILGMEGAQTRKFGSANWLWDRDSLEKGKDRRKEKDAAMSAHSMLSLEDVFHSIIAQIRTSELPESYTVAGLKHVIPRPTPESAASIGTPLGSGRSADPPSRRGEIRKPRSRKQEDSADEEDGNEDGAE